MRPDIDKGFYSDQKQKYGARTACGKSQSTTEDNGDMHENDPFVGFSHLIFHGAAMVFASAEEICVERDAVADKKRKQRRP